VDDEYGYLETEMNRGFIQVLVLVCLENQMYGYQMLRHFQEQGYQIEENTLYPLLRRLEKNKLIESKWDVGQDRPRKFYVVSEQGKKVREKLLNIRHKQNKVIDKLLEAKNV